MQVWFSRRVPIQRFESEARAKRRDVLLHVAGDVETVPTHSRTEVRRTGKSKPHQYMFVKGVTRGQLRY
ncbi:MAG: hypothetical protein QE271_05010 [Bacteriovoracaceae bacterium]|nr:hypothetical protein [Bacteriovoracaceae bacterium]